ncbi:MAG: TonB-dependent receptor [Muribaculaceae bacterium]|nr:TonB-dependent receptor [Muribaculaceae bacterium]
MAKRLGNIRIVIKLAALFIALGAVDGTASAAVLKVEIIEANTSHPIEYAAIKLTSIATREIIGGYSDAVGKCSLRVEPGKWRIEASMVGYKPIRKQIDVADDDNIVLRLAPMESLDEVVVTARESKNATSASTIDTAAMQHLQPSSFSDLMELLPGGITKDPALGNVNSISLREASGITPTDDYATAALGTSFVIDGVRINTDADMQATPDANQSARISIGKGVDMRAISTDDIESVEIVRGIPSVEYGEITSGMVNIKRKSGVGRLEARFKADTQSQLLYLGKGFAVNGNENQVINAGIDYFDSKIDPRNNKENFKRVTASVRSNLRWNNPTFNIQWNSNAGYCATFEKDDNDPDIAVNNTIDFYKNDKHNFY